MNRLVKFVRLPTAEKLLLMKAWWLLVTATARLRVLSHQWNRTWIEAADNAGSTAPDDAAQHVSWAVAVVSRYVPLGRCLPQAIAAQKLLRGMGYRSTVRIGVRKPTESEFEAHAWLECDGRIWVGAQFGQADTDKTQWAMLR
jgi:hypothetical protein